MPKSDQGTDHPRYKVIPRTLVFITCGDKVLLIKGAPHKRLWANKYNGIGGHLERGEDILTGARREVSEETGLQLENLWLCGTVIVDVDEYTGVAIFVLRGIWEGGEIISSSEGQVEWVEINKILELPLVDDLRILLPQVLAMQTGAPPFFARSYYDGDDKLCVEIR